ncbi:uncharacterized oxidoreductase YjmC-like [Coccinella septempunctata]|uniref:uncharacterized oxidoreductase YjmC-like n=1 Tax=Coccinella septempunctata TaxID=41139 RepID=UPI001D07D347|nr:uncharacterized oxidoreductase YjmC-like [Coccinella septempunctata]
METEFETITLQNLTKFVTDCFVAAAVPKNHSEIMAASLIESDLMGRNGQGLFMLEECVTDVLSGLIDTRAVPKIDKESSATAWVDGKNALGPVVANFCIKLAIQKAKRVGASIVVAKHSNPFGAASRYTKLALDEGLIGWACSNTSPYMVPNRAKYASIGTNPISVGAPGIFGDYFLLDMSTSVASPNRIALKGFSSEYLPLGYAINPSGLAETDSYIAAKYKNFLPLGSEEIHSNYKGTGLSLMMDILCGILGGSYYGTEVGIVGTDCVKRKANISHCFIIVDPKYFASGFEMRMTELMVHLRNLEPLDPDNCVRVPGDMTKDIGNKVKEWGGIRYPKFVIESMNKVAKFLRVKCVELIPKPTTIVLTPSEELAQRLEMEEKSRSMQKEEDASVSQDVPMDDEVSDKISLYSVYELDEDPSDWMLK